MSIAETDEGVRALLTKAATAARSAKSAQDARRRAQAAVRSQVFDRDSYRCALRDVAGAGRCHGPLTPHHRRKASQGGAYSLENLATLCRHHNDLLEARADVASIGERLGLVLRRSPLGAVAPLVHTGGEAS